MTIGSGRRFRVSRISAIAFGVLAAASVVAPPAAAQNPPRKPDRPPDVVPETKRQVFESYDPAWIKEIAARQSKINTLVAEYELKTRPRGERKDRVEAGTVKMQMGSGRVLLERWEGRVERTHMLRIVRDGMASVWIDGVAQPVHDVKDKSRLTPSMFNYPFLPLDCDATYTLVRSSEVDPAAALESKDRPPVFPSGLVFRQKNDEVPSPRFQRMDALMDTESGLIFGLRWFEMDGGFGLVDLYDLKPNAAVSPVDFQIPQASGEGVSGADPAGGAVAPK